MELLENPEDRGYPTEYLLSRIRGRRARLIKDWKSLVFDLALLDSLSLARYRGLVTGKSPEGVWRQLIKEFRWVYTQMHASLREIFRPFFLYAELRTLFICLRRLKEKTAGGSEELLAASLLCEELKAVLSKSEDIAAAVAGIERIFITLSAEFKGLAEVADREGLRGVEQRLTNTYLVHALHMKLHPLMKTFFVRLIDARNIITAYKRLRLGAKASPPFIPGGGISETRLREILDRQDMFAVAALVREFSGIKIETPDATKVESALYKGITRFLKKAGREPFGIGPILDYLWRCSIEAMNLSVLFYGRDLEREAVTAEIVS